MSSADIQKFNVKFKPSAFLIRRTGMMYVIICHALSYRIHLFVDTTLCNLSVIAGPFQKGTRVQRMQIESHKIFFTREKAFMTFAFAFLQTKT